MGQDVEESGKDGMRRLRHAAAPLQVTSPNWFLVHGHAHSGGSREHMILNQILGPSYFTNEILNCRREISSACCQDSIAIIEFCPNCTITSPIRSQQWLIQVVRLILVLIRSESPMSKTGRMSRIVCFVDIWLRICLFCAFLGREVAMSIWKSMCSQNSWLTAYLPTCLPAYLPTCLPAHLPTCLPAYLPTCLPAHLPTCLPACLPGRACRRRPSPWISGKITRPSERPSERRPTKSTPPVNTAPLHSNISGLEIIRGFPLLWMMACDYPKICSSFLSWYARICGIPPRFGSNVASNDTTCYSALCWRTRLKRLHRLLWKNCRRTLALGVSQMI